MVANELFFVFLQDIPRYGTLSKSYTQELTLRYNEYNSKEEEVIRGEGR